MKAAEIFNPRLVIGLIAAGIVAFAVLLLLIAYGGGSGGAGRNDRAGPLSVAATGFKGLTMLVGAHRQAHLDETSAEWAEHLLIVTVNPQHRPGDLARLLQRRGDNPTLIILPKWVTVNDPAHRGWVRALTPGLGEAAAPLLGENVTVSLAPQGQARTASGTGTLAGLAIPIPRAPQVVTGPDFEPLLSLPGGGALVAQIGDRPHFVVADPDLLNNHGLREPAQARAALAMIERMNEGRYAVDFDLSGGSGGETSPSMLRLAFEPPFLAMTLALFFAALVAGFYGAFRFGPVRREERAIAFGKSALVENSAGLIRLARREARLGGAYADVVRAEAARITSAPAWLSGEKLDAYLDRIGKAGVPCFTVLADAVTRAADRTGLIAAARALHLWKKDLVK